MNENNETPLKEPLFNKRFELLKRLKEMSVETLQKMYQSNEKIAIENHHRFQNFSESNQAIFTYTGQQFKHLDAKSLDQNALNHLHETLFIMSGLYGLVRPFDKIGLYRLPMGVKWFGSPLKNEWIDLISNSLANEVVLNLASKEYYDAIDSTRVNVIRVDFLIIKDGKYRKAGAMEAKKLRGKMVRSIALNQTNSIDEIKQFSLDGYTFNETKSSDSVIVFVNQ